MKKRVLIFSLDYLPGAIGGAESAIEEITKRISSEEIEFHMVTLYYDSTWPRVEKIGNILVHRVGLFSKPEPTAQERKAFPLHYNKHFFQFAAAFKAMRLHKKYNYDVVWAMMAHSTGVPAAIFKMFNKRTPFVLTLQEGDPPEYIEKLMKPVWPLFSRAFTSADMVQSISTFLGQWAEKMGFAGELKLIHNGANPRDIHATHTQEELEELKKEIGKKDGDIFLTNTARLVTQKGFDTTIRALPSLPEYVRLLIVGGGPEEQALKNLVKELNLGERVIFTGQVDRTVVSKYRRIADVFVGPSRSEGLGNAFLSAMASGLPVVATQVGGIADFLFDAERNPEKETTGWAVDKDKPEQIVAAIRYILDNPKEVQRVTENARELILKEYDWDIIAERMQHEVFESVVTR